MGITAPAPPISLEGHLTPANATEAHELGINILVFGSVFDIAIEEAIDGIVRAFVRTAGQRVWWRPR